MSENLVLTMRPTPTQAEFMLSKGYVRVLAGPIGSGKSVTCVHELIRWATEQAPNHEGIRKTRFLICRNTVDQLRSTTLKTIFDWLPPGQAGQWVETQKTYFVRFGLDDGTIVESEWMAIALDTPDDVRKALSLEATGLWGNEARELHPDVVEGLLMRVNRYPSPKDGGPTRPGAIFDTNMPQIGSWWFDKMVNPPNNWTIHEQPPAVLPIDEYVKKYGVGAFEVEVGRHRVRVAVSESGDVEAWAWTGDTGPVSLVCENSEGDRYVVDHEADNFGMLNASYYPNTLEGKSREFIDVYLRGKFGQSREGRPVFESFRRDFHVATKPLVPIASDLAPIIIGMDFGLTPACTLSQVDPRGRLLTFAEVSSSNMGIYRFLTEKLVPLLTARFAGHKVIVVGDPAGRQRSQTDEKTVYDIIQAAGLKAMPAPTNDIVRRIGAVEEYLGRVIDGQPGHLIDPSCKELIAGFSGGYRYRMRRNGEIEDKPEKNSYSHLMDAHQYACLYAREGGGASSWNGVKERQKRAVKIAPMGAWI